jgi:fluoride exporter
MRSSLLVFVGAGCGGVLRHLVNLWVTGRMGFAFPWGVFFINISGSLIMGLIAGYFAFKSGTGWSPQMRLFLTTGVLGGYTTFSAFSLDAALLIERGELWSAGLYVAGSVVFSIAGLFLGLSIIRTVA